jgi:hypothetical protein
VSLSNAAESDLLLLLFQNAAWANVGTSGGLQPSSSAGNLYVALHTASPGQAGNQSTNEAAYPGYSRQAVARSSAGWTKSGSNPTQVANAAAVTFGAAASGSETETYFSVGTSSTGAGEIIFYAPLAQALLVTAGIVPNYPISSLICKVQ